MCVCQLVLIGCNAQWVCHTSSSSSPSHEEKTIIEKEKSKIKNGKNFLNDNFLKSIIEFFLLKKILKLI